MELLVGTRREDPVRRSQSAGRTQRPVADAVAVSLKTLELLLAGLRHYTVTTTTSTVVRVIVDQLARLI